MRFRAARNSTSCWQRTRERAGVSDWNAYAGKIDLDAAQNSKAWRGNKVNAHTSMIRGYNRKTHAEAEVLQRKDLAFPESTTTVCAPATARARTLPRMRCEVSSAR